MKKNLPPLILSMMLTMPITAQARDGEGRFMPVVSITCGAYLNDFSRSTVTGGTGFNGPHALWKANGHILGIITGYNYAAINGKKDVSVGMELNDIYRWVASWCRDNPAKRVHNGVFALIKTLERN
jgi:hypothetical protein